MISESNLNCYRLFCAVAECESISRAAEMNYISQPAISKAITKMEESLGTQLFIRNHSMNSLKLLLILLKPVKIQSAA